MEKKMQNPYGQGGFFTRLSQDAGFTAMDNVYDEIRKKKALEQSSEPVALSPEMAAPSRSAADYVGETQVNRMADLKAPPNLSTNPYLGIAKLTASEGGQDMAQILAMLKEIYGR